jgi:hypothetical protein
MKILGLIVVALWIGWDFEPSVLDTLEYSDDAGISWAVVPGPYRLDSARTTIKVRVETHSVPARLFRVARIWGDPWVVEE